MAASKPGSKTKRPAISPSSVFPRLAGRRAIVTFHSLGDLDAVGGAIALQRHLGKNAIIAPPDKPNSSARKLLEYAQVQTTPFSEIKRNPKDAVIVLDSSSPHLLFHLAGIKPSLIIDHHARFGGEISAEKEILDPSASSVCEMLYYLLKPTDKLSCMALLLGLISDSAAFKYATPRTFTAAAYLLEHSGMSYSQLSALAASPESIGERIESLRSCQSVSAEKIGEHIVATALAKSHEAHFADMLINLGADIAFVGCQGESAHISARMRHELSGRVRLEKIMFEVGKILGGAGSGHELAAGASGALSQNLKAALGICVKMAEQQLLSAESGKIKKIEW
ncbi:MAG: DHH family phosphoesterase [Candidatus Anstonellaceae archaeon]